MARQTLRLGSRGSDVSAWQAAIGVAADGVFGPQTEAATKIWQAAHALVADGVVGPLTWATVDSASDMPGPRAGFVLGIDTSVSQGVVDWPAVKEQGVSFGFVKATDGVNTVDGRWQVNSAGALAAGVLTGSYHVLEPGTDPTAQAQHYTAVARGTGQLPPVLDFELAKGLSAVDALARAVAFVDAVEAAWDRPCLVYAGPAFIEQLAALAGAAGAATLAKLSQRRLWVAHYGVPLPSVPPPWVDWSFWQFAGDGGYRLPNGVVVDVDWFQGSQEALQAVALQLPK
jgi:lysozyme